MVGAEVGGEAGRAAKLRVDEVGNVGCVGGEEAEFFFDIAGVGLVAEPVSGAEVGNGDEEHAVGEILEDDIEAGAVAGFVNEFGGGGDLQWFVEGIGDAVNLHFVPYVFGGA